MGGYHIIFYFQGSYHIIFNFQGSYHKIFYFQRGYHLIFHFQGKYQIIFYFSGKLSYNIYVSGNISYNILFPGKLTHMAKPTFRAQALQTRTKSSPLGPVEPKWTSLWLKNHMMFCAQIYNDGVRKYSYWLNLMVITQVVFYIEGPVHLYLVDHLRIH